MGPNTEPRHLDLINMVLMHMWIHHKNRGKECDILGCYTCYISGMIDSRHFAHCFSFSIITTLIVNIIFILQMWVTRLREVE